MESIYNHIIKTQASNTDKVLIKSVATNLIKKNLIFNKKTASSFDSFFQKNALLRKEVLPNFIVDKSQDKSKVITFCHPTPQLHNDIDTPLSQNTFTPAKKPESDLSTVKIEALIMGLKSYISCESSMINAKSTSFSDHINKTISNLKHSKDKHLESLQDNISFLEKKLLMKNKIIKTLTDTETAVWDTMSTSQRMFTVSKESLDAPETLSNTSLVTHHQQQQQQQHQQ